MSRTTTVRHHVRHTKKKVVPVRRHSRKVYIPPAWKDVKYYKNKPYLATGVDEKGRTQYVYPQDFVEKQKRDKFKRIESLDNHIRPLIREVSDDAKKDNQEAQVVYTMYVTGFRPGNDRDLKADKKAFGTITLKKDHVKVNGDTVKFEFVGKKGVPIKKEVKDKKLARIMSNRKRIAEGKDLFETNEYKVREYFDDKTDGDYMLKDLRTLKANEIAEKYEKMEQPKMVEKVAKELGNTPSVAKGSYINPEVLK